MTYLMQKSNKRWNTFNLVRKSILNTKFATLATKAELKADKILKLEAFNSSYFHGNFVFSDNIF